MKETIYTIPLSEIFGEISGCPICRLRDRFEKKSVDYITGAAMMEPDIRIVTNEKGFCERHFRDMLFLGGRRLPVCLMLESHLAYIESQMLQKADKASVKKLEALDEDCYVCDFVERNMARELEIIYRTYRLEQKFRESFAAQEYICLPHYRRMIVEGKKQLSSEYDQFCKVARGLALSKCKKLRAQLEGFENAFDHRNAGKPMPQECRDSLERTAGYLTARSFD